MLICFDIGNSTVSIGCFGDNGLLYATSIPSNPRPNIEQWEGVFEALLKYGKKERYEVTGVAYSSVVPDIEEKVKEAAISYFGLEPYSVTIASDLGLRVNVDHPEEVGADLLSDAVAAKKISGGDTVIVDMGTATKIILLGEEGSFEGCTIGVGPGIAKKALNLDTAALPEVEFSLPKKVLGKNTHDSINSALFYGLSAEARGLCDMIEREYGKPLHRVLTGGYANLIKELLGEFSFYPDLALYGVREVYLRNKKA
ncbi:MAG: type III pantothenate kinase [Bacilli bacterium]|nr:type III pantothenate kinase [Bacilli bacterium]